MKLIEGAELLSDSSGEPFENSFKVGAFKSQMSTVYEDRLMPTNPRQVAKI